MSDCCVFVKNCSFFRSLFFPLFLASLCLRVRVRVMRSCFLIYGRKCISRKNLLRYGCISRTAWNAANWPVGVAVCIPFRLSTRRVAQPQHVGRRTACGAIWLRRTGNRMTCALVAPSAAVTHPEDGCVEDLPQRLHHLEVIAAEIYMLARVLSQIKQTRKSSSLPWHRQHGLTRWEILSLACHRF